MSTRVRTRFAPSPTGNLHVGGARTALYSWLYAKKMGGDFILRIEDTDQARSTKESVDIVLQDLKWLKYDWQEGPEVGGPCQPYFQSERLSIYKEHADRLLKTGKAYYCFCSDERLEKMKEDAIKNGRPPHYDRTCANIPYADQQARLAKGEKGAVRFKIPGGKDSYTFHDLIRKDVTFPSDMVGDFVVLRSDGMPVYNFCCVVDDALMNITHVLRAEEHLSNTLRQMMIYEAFNYPMPAFGHLSIILGADKQKLSKRHGATSVKQYEEMGYLPEAMTNFLALLGWSSPDGKEIMNSDELIKNFDLDRLHAAAAVFDEVKLKWMNSMYLRELPHKDLWLRIEPFLAEAGLNTKSVQWQNTEWQDKVLAVFKTSMETLKDAVPLFTLLDDESFKIQEEAKEVFTWESTKAVLTEWKKQVEAHKSESFTEADFNQMQDAVKNNSNVKGKFLFMPLRVAVIGKAHGAELKQLVPCMTKQSLIFRADVVCKTF
jgi:nondiscriminating glutamyl-tRNA synthetase